MCINIGLLRDTQTETGSQLRREEGVSDIVQSRTLIRRRERRSTTGTLARSTEYGLQIRVGRYRLTPSQSTPTIKVASVTGSPTRR